MQGKDRFWPHTYPAAGAPLLLGLNGNHDAFAPSYVNRLAPRMLDVGDRGEPTVCLRSELFLKYGGQRWQRAGRNVRTPSRNEPLKVTVASLRNMGSSFVGNDVGVQGHRRTFAKWLNCSEL
jgi:hypothetical protein